MPGESLKVGEKRGLSPVSGKTWSVPVFAIAWCCASVAGAEELGLLGGTARSDHGRHSGAWALDFQHNLGAHLAIGGGVVNDGHAANDHRDAAAIQVRARATVFHPRLTLTAGVGPLYYFDTTRADRDAPDHVDHGWGLIYSLSATWELGSSWYVQARMQRVDAHDAFRTTSVLFGGGYRFGPVAPGTGSGAGSLAWAADPPGSSIGVYAGRVIANTFSSESAPAQAVEYRRKVRGPVEWTVSALNEGDTGPVRRYGIATQAWAMTDVGNERFRVGAGVGPYFLLGLRRHDQDGSRDANDKDRLAGVASLTAAYAVSPAWDVRLLLNRVFAERSRDTDVVMLGVGYRY